MNKNKMTFARVVTTFVMVAILCLGMAAPALASEPPISTGSEENSAEAAITKVLVIADGTDIPDRTYEFTFTPKAVAGVTVLAGEMPGIPPATISMNEGDRNLANKPVNGIVTVPKQTTQDIFSGAKWPHAGVYLYTVKETKGSDEHISYSAGAYDVYVYVANKEDGSGLYVAGISARIAVNDASNENTSTGAKVDPTPGGNGEDYSQSRIIFTNTYLKDIDETDPTVEGNQKFVISKTVTNDYGDHTKYFKFTLTTDRPATLEAEATYKAYVVETVGGVPQVVTSKENHATVMESEGLGDYIDVTTGGSATIYLKHGQKLVFTGIHDGASYIVEEAAERDYTASVEIVESGKEGITLANTGPNVKRSSAPEGDAGLMRIISGKGNAAAFTNQYKDVTPLGISVYTLPYITLITIIIIACAAYVVFVYRRRAKDEK